MADHELDEPLVTEGLSPKLYAATVWAFLAPMLLVTASALLEYLIANPTLFSALPPVVQVPIVAFLGALGAAVAAYRAKPGLLVPQNR
jgi:hypothetical protein